MKSKRHYQELPFWALMTASCIFLFTFVGWRLWLNRAYGEAILSPGGLLFVLLFLCLGALTLESTRLETGQGWRLALAFIALVSLFSGESLLWLRSADKADYFWAGYALLVSGALLLLGALRSSALPEPLFLSRKWEWGILVILLLMGAGARAYHLGPVPGTWWYDELNLARASRDHILSGGEMPIYVTENVENPGMYLWICGLVFKFFGVGIIQLRWLSAFFGWLSLLPFYFLARRLLGVAWGLAALALFCAMRWTLIPQHIAFMSGFAIFWTLCAIYFYWRALNSRKILDFGLAGLCMGFTLHCYTPTRLVIPMLILFSLWQWRKLRGVSWKAWAALGLGFVVVAGPMLYYIATHWAAYSMRAQQVSIMKDVHDKGWMELYISFTRHLQCFNFRGDFNARHNIHFWPQLDFVSGGIFVAAILWAHGRAFKDPRASLFVLWFWIMLSAGIFSMTIESPQAHRTILVAPLTALCSAWFLGSLWAGLGDIWEFAWPKPLGMALLGVLVAVPLFNSYELYANWPEDSATWRSFSPESTLAARRAAMSPADWLVFLSPLKNEYQFDGYERNQFVSFALSQQRRDFIPMTLSQAANGGGGFAPQGVLAIWGQSDEDITAAMKRDFPGVVIEEAKDPFEPRDDYLAAAIPWAIIPSLKKVKVTSPLFYKP